MWGPTPNPTPQQYIRYQRLGGPEPESRTLALDLDPPRGSEVEVQNLGTQPYTLKPYTLNPTPGPGISTTTEVAGWKTMTHELAALPCLSAEP